MNPGLLAPSETGLLGSVRGTGLYDFGKSSFNADGSRKSFADTKASLKDVADAGRLASLAGVVASNKELAGLGAGVSQFAGIASDPTRGLLGTVMSRVAPGVPAAAVMGAFDANRKDRDMTDSVATSVGTALASKALFAVNPLLGVANAVSGVFGGPTVGSVVRDGYNYLADKFEGIDPDTSFRTVQADLDDAGWRDVVKPTEKDLPEPTDEEAAAAPEQMAVPDDGSFDDGTTGNYGKGSGWGGGFGTNQSAGGRDSGDSSDGNGTHSA